eukprot:COSAG02_NODE_8554_length_2524_cov_97.366374_3_plen_122_part_00
MLSCIALWSRYRVAIHSKLSSYVMVDGHMVDTPEYFLLGTYNQSSSSFAPAAHRAGTLPDQKIIAASARLYPADYGIAFASQTFWDPQLRRRLLATWLATANNTHGIPRELSVVADEDDAS